MTKIGLITYHSAYNFGSILQAYATQEVIKRIGGNCEIINYRSKEQKKFYGIFKWKKGIVGFSKSFLKNLLSLADYKNKLNRQNKYEEIVSNLFNLTPELSSYDDICKIWNNYNIIVSGSDQIWNKHSNELENVGWEEMDPYLLKNYGGKKISYASSITNMTDVELHGIVPLIKQFDFVSIRENESAMKLKNSFNVECKNVLDPTFLLTKNDWIKKLNLRENQKEKYILYYVLGGRKEVKKSIKSLKKFSNNNKIKIKMIMPLSFFKSDDDIEILNDVDPIEFMNLILNAHTVITDSYHGTILSVNLEVNIFSVCKGHPSDFRKVDILNRIGLRERIISDMNDILDNQFFDIDYQDVKSKINILRDDSYKYLEDAINDCRNYVFY